MVNISAWHPECYIVVGTYRLLILSVLLISYLFLFFLSIKINKQTNKPNQPNDASGLCVRVYRIWRKTCEIHGETDGRATEWNVSLAKYDPTTRIDSVLNFTVAKNRGETRFSHRRDEYTDQRTDQRADLIIEMRSRRTHLKRDAELVSSGLVTLF